jgi:hypothetical protein
MIKEAILADQRLDMVSQMEVRGDTYGAELFRSLRRTMEEWQEVISNGAPGEVVPRERWEAVFTVAKEIAEKIDASGRLPSVLK